MSNSSKTPLKKTLKLCLCSLLVLVACERPLPKPDTLSAASIHYTVEADPDLKKLWTRVCFQGFVPQQLKPQIHPAALALLNAQHTRAGSPVRLISNQEGIVLRGLSPGSCVNITLDLKALELLFHDRGDARRYGNALLLSPDYWLWQPHPLPPNLTTSISTLNDRFALPWRSAPSDTLWRWRTQGALGQFERQHLRFKGDSGNHDVVFIGYHNKSERMRWLNAAVEATTHLFGEFPVSSSQIIVVSESNKRIDGRTTRGGGPSVTLFVGTEHPAKQTSQVALHEFLHLGLPYLPSEDAWFDEGIATYYQTVLQARVGQIDAKHGWEQLHKRFQRGAKADAQRTLRQDSARMQSGHPERSTRIFWAGAALAFIADIALREAQQGSLDDQVRALRTCCLSATTPWRAVDLMQNAPGGELWSGVVEGYLDETAFPDMKPFYQKLGLRFDDDGTLLTRPNDPGRDMRRAILGQAIAPY